jgi:hypothetical protein
MEGGVMKFLKHAVVGNGHKARVRYSAGPLISGRVAVTLYAKGPLDGPDLEAVFASQSGYENNSDGREDYFENGRARIYEGDPLYPAALAIAQGN